MEKSEKFYLIKISEEKLLKSEDKPQIGEKNTKHMMDKGKFS